MKWQIKLDKLLAKICIMKLVRYDYYNIRHEEHSIVTRVYNSHFVFQYLYLESFVNNFAVQKLFISFYLNIIMQIIKIFVVMKLSPLWNLLSYNLTPDSYKGWGWKGLWKLSSPTLLQVCLCSRPPHGPQEPDTSEGKSYQ